MGVFYDPFVLTTALSMVTDKRVLWRIFSKELPELLVADLGPTWTHMQVCLQPHVYVPQLDAWRGGAERNYYGRDDEQGQNNWGGPRRREQPALSNEAHQDWHGAVSSTAGAPARGGNGYAPSSLPAQVGGVKDQDGFNRYLSSQEKGGSKGGFISQHDPSESTIIGGPRAGASEAQGAFSLSPDAPPRHEQAAAVPQRYLEPRGGSVSPMPADEPKATASADAAASAPSPPPPGSLPKANKFNKIGARGGGAAANQAGAMIPGATPLLQQLLPIQRAHLVNCVRKELKATTGADADRFKKAEEYLSRCGGDYEMAYSYVRGLTENAGLA